MYVSKVYIPLADLSEIFMKNMSDTDKERFKGCEFVPISIKLNENDMSLEGLFVPTPSSDTLGDCSLHRRHISKSSCDNLDTKNKVFTSLSFPECTMGDGLR